jgi:hypothetical protein
MILLVKNWRGGVKPVCCCLDFKNCHGKEEGVEEARHSMQPQDSIVVSKRTSPVVCVASSLEVSAKSRVFSRCPSDYSNNYLTTANKIEIRRHLPN